MTVGKSKFLSQLVVNPKGVYKVNTICPRRWRGQSHHDLAKKLRNRQQFRDAGEKDNSSCTFRLWELITKREIRKHATRVFPWIL